MGLSAIQDRRMLRVLAIWTVFVAVTGSASHGGDVPAAPTCAFQDQVKSEGDTWHPYVQPIGVARCVLCTCKNGTVDCLRTKCPILNCTHTLRRPKTCCEECDASPIMSEHETSGAGPVISEHEASGGCTERFTMTERQDREKWQPISSSHGTAGCDVCTCQDRTISCRTRCPRVCHKDLTRNSCCRFCSEEVKAKARERAPPTRKRPRTGQVAAKKSHQFQINIRDFLALLISRTEPPPSVQS